MKRTVIYVAFLGVLLGRSVAVGQEQPLKALEPLIGTWEFKGETWEDGPFAPKGTKFSGQSCYKWIWGSTGIQLEAWIQFGEGPRVSVSNVIAWNPGLKKIVLSGMSSAGGSRQGVLSFDAETKTLKDAGKGTTPEGKEVSSTICMTFKDNDTFIWQATKQVVDGEKMPDSMKVTGTRVKSK